MYFGCLLKTDIERAITEGLAVCDETKSLLRLMPTIFFLLLFVLEFLIRACGMFSTFLYLLLISVSGFRLDSVLTYSGDLDSR